ncbi:hypothetical protein [Renibacterium salmoninarum]|uniref:hypothetical protein n=1 Tax=Renibacterium salmoninarum TaxID=1646 RepID=UPI0011AB87A2|nr:hypothetical protein [Renibacterium salmoninarum]
MKLVVLFTVARMTGMTRAPCMIMVAITVTRTVAALAERIASSNERPAPLFNRPDPLPLLTLLSREKSPAPPKIKSVSKLSTVDPACTNKAEPNIALPLRRAVWNAPSRISPKLRGRSGITPGFGGATYCGYPGSGPGC